MKILQAVAASSAKTGDESEEYGLVCCSRSLPEAIRKEAQSFAYPPHADGAPIHSLKTMEVDSARWVLLNRAAPVDKNTGAEGHVCHTLAIREDDLMAALDSSGGVLPSALGFVRTSEWVKSWTGETRWLEDDDDLPVGSGVGVADTLAQSHLRSLLDELKRDFSTKAQEKSADEKKQVEAIVAEFRREVTALHNRVEEYKNAKWWHFDDEEAIQRRRCDIDQLERTAKKAAEDRISEYREKASPILRLLSDTNVSGKDGTPAEPQCFSELIAKFDKLATDYREFSRIITICDKANLAETSTTELNSANATLGEQLAGARRELEVSKMSDKIMSSQMRTDRKDKAREKAGKSSMMSWQTIVIIVLSLAVAGLIASHFL